MHRHTCCVLVVVSLLVAAAGLSAQAPADAPQFEVASIKPSTYDGPSNYWQVSGRRFSGNKSQIVQLIRMSWGDMQMRVEGAPEWIVAERFDVIGNSPVDIAPGSQALSRMMRALLIERFKLAAHIETRDTPIYALVLARPDRAFGPRLQAPMAECPVADGASLAFGACGPGVEGGLMRYGNTTMRGLALNISRRVGRRVIDDTGLPGGYRVDLEFTPQPTDAALPPPGQPLPPLPDGPSIFDALQQQLGLKLESRRGAVEVLVVDHIERPTPN